MLLAALIAGSVLAGPASALPPMTTLAGGGDTPAANGVAGTDVALGGLPFSVAALGLDSVGVVDPPPNGAFAFNRSSDCKINVLKNTTFDGAGQFEFFAGGSACQNANFETAVPANGPSLNLPSGLSGTDTGNLFIADPSGGRVHFVSAGQIRTIAGNACLDTASTSGSPTSAALCEVTDVAAHPSINGTYLIAEKSGRPTGGRVYLVQGATDPINGTMGTISVVAGGGCPTPSAPPGAVCFSNDPLHVEWVDGPTPSGFVVVEGNTPFRAFLFGSTDLANNTLVVETPMGQAMGDITTMPDGTYLVAEPDNCRVRRLRLVNLEFEAENYAGTTCGAPLGDGLPAGQAGLGNVNGLDMMDTGLLIADTTNRRIRFVERTVITSGPPEFSNSIASTFSFDSTDRTPTFECSTNNNYDASVKVTWFSCTSGSTFGGTDPLLEEGVNKFWVRSVRSTNPPHEDDTPASYEWTIDTTLPTTVDLIEPPDGAGGQAPTPTFKWSESSDTNFDHYELWIDGAKDSDVACCEAPPATPLSEAAHTWQIRAVDKAGNAGESATRTLNAGSPPVADFAMSPNPVLVGRLVNFDAAAATDPSGIAKVEWDLDGDGTYETDTGAERTTSRSYTSAGDVTIGLRVTDGVGLTSVALKSLRVNALTSGTQIGVSINDGARYTNRPDVKLAVNAPAGTSTLLVANDGGFLKALTFAPAPQIAWKLDSSGPERLPKTVYLRFLTGTFASPNFTDDIILDERPPVVDQAVLVTPAAATAAVARTYRLRVRARDSNSGVRGVQVTANKRRPGKLLRYKRSLRVRAKVRPRFLRAKDRAGNYSRWKKLR